MADRSLFTEISLAEVDLEDHAFVVPGVDDLGQLLASIQEVGLINPPCLRARGADRWQVVAGRKRLQAAAQLGWQTIPAHILPADTPDSRCLLLALYDNAFSRRFNLWEQAVLARRLLAYWDPVTVATKFLPYLGLPPSAAHLERLSQAGTLEPPWQELCARGRLALTAAAFLAQWPAADRLAALPYLEALTFSQSKQEQFLEDVELLARREKVSPKEILSRGQLWQLLQAADLNPAARAEEVRRLLRGWVNPRLTATLAAFREALSRLGLKGHPRLNLQPPPAFEGPDFHLEIKFRDTPELQKLLQEINRLTEQEEFSAINRL